MAYRVGQSSRQVMWNQPSGKRKDLSASLFSPLSLVNQSTPMGINFWTVLPNPLGKFQGSQLTQSVWHSTSPELRNGGKSQVEPQQSKQVKYGLLMCYSSYYVEHINYAQAQSLLQKRLKELVMNGTRQGERRSSQESTKQAAKPQWGSRLK